MGIKFHQEQDDIFLIAGELDRVRSKLASEGWAYVPHLSGQYLTTYGKSHSTTHGCQVKAYKKPDTVAEPSVDVFLKLQGPRPYQGTFVWGCEIELVGGLEDGTCVQFANHNLPPSVEGALEYIPRLIAAWECVAAL